MTEVDTSDGLLSAKEAEVGPNKNSVSNNDLLMFITQMT